MQEFVPMVALIAVVMIVAYVARRAQSVGLPPGVAKDPPAEVSPPAPPSVSFTSSHDAATEPDQRALSSQLGRHVPSKSSAPRNRRRDKVDYPLA